jgi:phage recombination protein Bet
MPKVTKFPVIEQEKAVQPIAEQKIQKETILEYLKVFGFDKSLSETEIQQFIQTALAGNLDPFKREIYIAAYGEGVNRKVSILTGYQVYLKRAERTGKLDGWHARIDGNGSQMKAVVEIFRKDWSHSFIHEVYWEEAVQKKKDGSPTQFWTKQPRFQLRKVAMAQAFRLAFPDELGGLPYESAELPEPSNGHEMQGSPQSTENTADASSKAVRKPNKKENVKTSIYDSNDNPTDDASDESLPFGDNAASESVKSVSTQDTGFDEQDFNSENDFLEKAIQKIEGLFETFPKEFTEKHQAWILDKVYKATDKAGIEKMLAYTEKVIRKAA